MDLFKIKQEMFDFAKSDISDIEKGLTIVCGIEGVSTKAASGLLAILFPAHFGTVDKFVVESLQKVHDPKVKKKVAGMNPERLTQEDAVVLIDIMREKAHDLNRTFDKKCWTPRKLDKVLWSIGR